MRYALIIAGGSGTRLWPMSRNALPKQLIPFIGGKSLLQIAVDRLSGLVPTECQYICAGEKHRKAILSSVKGAAENRFLGEPEGRDTLNAVGFAAAAIAASDPEAVIAVFTADHVIEPVDQFQKIVGQGFAVAESQPNTLVTFGIKPTQAATGYGYLELGADLGGGAKAVSQFKEKPDAPTAKRYLDAGPGRYLWNSGMFVWRARTLLDAIRKFAPENAAGLDDLGKSWNTPKLAAKLAEVYPKLKKISVDFAVMEPASRDPHFRVAAVPMPLSWLDVGSWPSFAQTLTKDAAGNTISAAKTALVDTTGSLIASNDPNHVVTAIGCENLIVIHTPEATLVCRADRAEDIKKLHALVGEKFGSQMQ